MMTIKTAAEKWGVSRQTIYDWIEQGLVAVERIEGGPQVVLSRNPPQHHRKKGEKRAKKRA